MLSEHVMAMHAGKTRYLTFSVYTALSCVEPHPDSLLFVGFCWLLA